MEDDGGLVVESPLETLGSTKVRWRIDGGLIVESPLETCQNCEQGPVAADKKSLLNSSIRREIWV